MMGKFMCALMLITIIQLGTTYPTDPTYPIDLTYPTDLIDSVVRKDDSLTMDPYDFEDIFCAHVRDIIIVTICGGDVLMDLKEIGSNAYLQNLYTCCDKQCTVSKVKRDFCKDSSYQVPASKMYEPITFKFRQINSHGTKSLSFGILNRVLYYNALSSDIDN